MFVMTADIEFEGFEKTKPSSLKWNLNIDNISDTAVIVIPAMCRVIDKENVYNNIPVGQRITEGTKVEIYAGYDGENDLQFKGFVKRLNFKVPMEIECEGYSYQLRRKIINKSFGKTTVKEVLNYLLEGTDITLSDKCPDKIVFEAQTFRNYTGLQLLEYLKEKYLLTVFFEFDKLYVGWRATYNAGKVKLRLNWNVVKDDQLLFSTYTGSTVHIEAITRQKTGATKKKKAGNVLKPGDVKQVKTFSTNETDMELAANDLQLQENKKGFTGGLLSFLKPFIRPGMTVEIIDKKYQERNGSYFIDSVDGSFNTSGGRQNVKIGFGLSTNG